MAVESALQLMLSFGILIVAIFSLCFHFTNKNRNAPIFQIKAFQDSKQKPTPMQEQCHFEDARGIFDFLYDILVCNFYDCAACPSSFSFSSLSCTSSSERPCSLTYRLRG
nr:putative holin-like toxin [Bacillus paralicheniformis]